MTRSAAFTLVEMMVALAVTGVLTVMMLRMFSDSSTIWKTEDDRLDTFREARAALQLMSRELSSAKALPDAKIVGSTTQYPALALRNLKSARDAKDPNSLSYYQSAWLLSATPNSGRSDLCAVGYSLAWEPEITTTAAAGSTATPTPSPDARKAYVLRRQITQSDTTFAWLRETLKPTAPAFGDTAFVRLYGRVAPALPVGATSGATPYPTPSSDTIASYIWDLQFAAAPPTTTGSATPAPTTTATEHAYYGTQLPAWVEIRFKALGSTAARKLATSGSVTKELWSSPQDPTYIRLILPSEQQFVSRVKLSR